MNFELLLLPLGICLLIFALFYSKGREAIENTPTSKARSVAMGFAELKGVAQPTIMLTSPYSKFPCVYYKYKVETETYDQHNKKHRKTIREGESGTPFYLNDETGRILVSPRSAQIDLSNIQESGSSPEIVTEWYIMAGEVLYVAGTVGKIKDFRSVELDRDAHYRQELKRCKDLLADVDLKPGEWASPQARETARERFGKDIRALEEKIASFDRAQNDAMAEEIAVGKGSADTAFIISDKSEADLTQRMAYSNSLTIAAAACMILYALWSILRG